MKGQLKLSSESIHEKDFSRSLRGFEPDEVDDFLDMIIRDYEKMNYVCERIKKGAVPSSTELPLSISPQEIHDKQFKMTFRGYDEEEVNEFLDLIIQDYFRMEEYYRSLLKMVQNQQEVAVSSDTKVMERPVRQERQERHIEKPIEEEKPLRKRETSESARIANATVTLSMVERLEDIQKELLLFENQYAKLKRKVEHLIEDFYNDMKYKN